MKLKSVLGDGWCDDTRVDGVVDDLRYTSIAACYEYE